MNQSKLKNDQSLLLIIYCYIVNLLSLLSINLLLRKKIWDSRRKYVPFCFNEIYVTVWALLISVSLFVIYPNTFLFRIIYYLSLYRLSELIILLSRYILVEPEIREDEFKNRVLIRKPNRWTLIIFINIYEIIFCFAFVYLYYGKMFQLPIIHPITAVYHSIMTLTTLGYGDIHPNCIESQLIVSIQLFYFLLFFLFIAPIVFSTIRTKVIRE